MANSILGMDVGGSSIKAGLVDVETGHPLTPLASVATPQPATPARVMDAIVAIDRSFASSGPVGLALPSVVQQGIARTAANIDKSWLGANPAELLAARIGRPVACLNDADAAGLAEMRWGAGRGSHGVAIMLTFGTGIGSALFTDGRLLPNTELGHLEVDGRDVETWASARVRTAEGLDWPAWAARVNVYLARMHALFWPDLFILGGAVSENFKAFAPLLVSPAEIRAAAFTGQAGIIGAALAASALGT
ncbi:MAG TPA: ROK family protein [Steroidobacteraceae bacterium]|jgi:polyphosphate glucokinase|nr:ROK family protein [Steroidobacteraceae bacterium]